MQSPTEEGVVHPDIITKIRENNKILLELLKKDCPEFVIWSSTISRFGANLIDAAILKQETYDKKTFRINFFSEENVYSIIIRPNLDSNDGYLGCTVSSRKSKAGEDWAMSHDLSDGPYCVETWNGILKDIVAFEFVRLGK